MAQPYSDEQIITALHKANGLISIAAKSLRCERATIYNRLKDSAPVAQALKDARDAMTDVAESSLFKKVKAGEGWAVCFYLKTQAKDRGYVERQELTGKDGGPIITKGYTNVSPDEWDNGSKD